MNLKSSVNKVSRPAYAPRCRQAGLYTSDTRILFEQSLETEGQAYRSRRWDERWTVYRVRLGDSITIVMKSPRGTQRQKVRSTCAQLQS